MTKLTDLATFTTDKGQQGKLIPATASGEGNQIMPNQGKHGSTNSIPRGTTA